MNRAPVGDLHQSRYLFLIQISFQKQSPLYEIDATAAILSVAVTVFRVNLLMTQSNRNLFQRPPFPVRIHAECNGSTGSESGQHQTVRRWSGIRTSQRPRFVGLKRVAVCKDIRTVMFASDGSNDTIVPRYLVFGLFLDGIQILPDPGSEDGTDVRRIRFVGEQMVRRIQRNEALSSTSRPICRK